MLAEAVRPPLRTRSSASAASAMAAFVALAFRVKSAAVTFVVPVLVSVMSPLVAFRTTVPAPASITSSGMSPVISSTVMLPLPVLVSAFSATVAFTSRLLP